VSKTLGSSALQPKASGSLHHCMPVHLVREEGTGCGPIDGPIDVIGGPIFIDPIGIGGPMDPIGGPMDCIGIGGPMLCIGAAIGAALMGSAAGALAATGLYDGVFRRRSSSCRASMYAACCL